MKIFVAGGNGFLGRRIRRKLEDNGMDYISNSLRDGIDYRNLDELKRFFKKEQVDVVLNCATFIGGIQFGLQHPAEIFYNNFMLLLNFLECSRIFKFKRVVNPISNCTYPARATLFKEDEFWDGPMHESVMTYGFARKGSWMGSWAYAKQYGTDWVNLILSNMYGPDDHFDEVRSHALGALIKKIVEAKRHKLPEVIVWGTGKPVREWLYIDDGAEAMIRAIDIKPHLDPINVGVGKGVSIKELAELIKETAGYEGELIYDTSKADGAPYKTVDGTKGERLLGWKPEMELEDGVRRTIEWYMNNTIE